MENTIKNGKRIVNNAGLPNMENERRMTSEAGYIEKKVYTAKDISMLLAISRTTTYDLLDKARKRNDMFRVIKIGDSVRVLKTEFDAWLEGGCQ